MLDGAQRDRRMLADLDEAHIRQDVGLGFGWSERGKRFHVASTSPGLAAKVSVYGLHLYNEGQVRLWPCPRANGEHTIDVLHRLRAEFPDRTLAVIWDGAPYHRAKAVWAVAASPRKPLGLRWHHAHAVAGLQSQLDAGGGIVALVARGRHLIITATPPLLI